MQSREQQHQPGRSRSLRANIESGPDGFKLLTLFIYFLILLIDFDKTVQAIHFDQNDLTDHYFQRHSMEPVSSLWRFKRQSNDETTTTSSTTRSPPSSTVGRATTTTTKSPGKQAGGTSTTHKLTEKVNTISSTKPRALKSTTASPTKISVSKSTTTTTTTKQPAKTTSARGAKTKIGPTSSSLQSSAKTTTSKQPTKAVKKNSKNVVRSHSTNKMPTGKQVAKNDSIRAVLASARPKIAPDGTMKVNVSEAQARQMVAQEGRKIAKNLAQTMGELQTLQRLVGSQRVKPEGGNYEARDVAAYLDSHQSHTIIDPRVYFTQQSPLGALAKLRDDMLMVPERLRFAYVMRTMNELGAKIASRLNMYNSQMLALLSKKPDGLGEKPGLSAYTGAIGQALAAFEDAEMVNINESKPTAASVVATKKPNTEAGPKTTPLPLELQKKVALTSALPTRSVKSRSKRALLAEAHKTISSFINVDKDKEMMFMAGLSSVANGLARAIMDFLLYSNGTNNQLLKTTHGDKRLRILGSALKNGAKNMIELMESNDKFKPESDNVGHMNKVLNETMRIILSHAHDANITKFADAQQAFGFITGYQRMLLKRVNPRGLSDANGLVGPWNSFLFEQLGTSERVVRVFAALLASVRENAAKTRFVNMYMPQVRQALSKTMSSFVALQAIGQLDKPSENYLVDYLDEKTLGKNTTQKLLDIQQNHEIDKRRLPARCYLAGRRWRLLLNMAMRHYDGNQNTIHMFVDKINQMKTALQSLQPGSTELERLCLPRLEAGLKGWGINGEPTGVSDEFTNKFPLRTPIEGLNKDEDPFTGGARMGYRLGFMVGYNDKRNQSLEMEKGSFIHRKTTKPNPPMQLETAPTTGNNAKPPCGEFCNYNSTGIGDCVQYPCKTGPDTRDEEQKRKAEVDYLAKASYRQGLTAGARKALEIACREGYMAALKVSVRAGMLLPLEAGSSLGSLKGANFASQSGGEAGRSFVNSYLMDKDLLDAKTLHALMEVGMTYGSLAGRQIGETIGSIAGHESALEAYRRAITRGGKIVRAKFHLDEFLAGAMVGFDFGLEEGGRVAQSSSLSPSAPKFFKLIRPQFSSKISSAFGKPPKTDNKSSPTTTPAPTGSRSGLIQLPASLPLVSTTSGATDDHWEQDLITPLSDRNIEDFHRARNHTRVTGTFKGTYNVAKEVKRGLQRESFANLTYDLEISAIGFAMNGVTYLSLSGKINNANVLHGSLVAQNIVT